MRGTWFISDTHFGHANILTFKDAEGRPLRPFANVQEMDDAMISNWNRLVHPLDRVYHMGDVVINRRSLGLVKALHGKKVLLRGNHDIFKLKDYIDAGFEDIRSMKVYPKHGMIVTHVPVHPQQLSARFKVNVHGHLHSNVIPDNRYVNLCVEKTDYAPVSFDQLMEKLWKEKD